MHPLIKIAVIIKKTTIRKRAFNKATQIIDDQPYWLWNKKKKRNLIRLNRICAGLNPFKWNGKPRWVRGVFECQVSLHNYGNVFAPPSLSDSVRDLVNFTSGKEIKYG